MYISNSQVKIWNGRKKDVEKNVDRNELNLCRSSGSYCFRIMNNASENSI